MRLNLLSVSLNKIDPITLDEVIAEKNRLEKDVFIDSIFGPKRSKSLACQQRVPARDKTKSKYYGVTKTGKKWRMRIAFLGRRASKVFETEEEAARAYDEMARKIWGEYAKVNFPTL